MRKDILEFLPAHNDDYDLTVRSCAGVLWLFLTVPLIGMQCVIMRPSQGFWGTWEKGYLFQGNRGTKAKY